MTPLDPAIADFLKAIMEALDGIADWRVSAVRSVVGSVRVGFDDPGAAADWLRGFLAQRERIAEDKGATVSAASNTDSEYGR